MRRLLSLLCAPALAIPAHAAPFDITKVDRYPSIAQSKTIDALTLNAHGGVILADTSGPATIQDFYTAPPSNYIAMSSGGARISQRALSGYAGPDTFRTMFAVEATSQVGATALETAANIEMRGLTGYARPWRTATAFAAGTQLTGPDGHHYVSAGACTSGAGPGPTATGSGQIDGSCTWNYLGDGESDNKTALLLTATAEGPQGALAGGGQVWTGAFIFGAKPGAWPNGRGFGTALELDAGNENRDCPPGDPNGCQIYGLYVNANGTQPSTIGLFLGGSVGFHIGSLISKAVDVAYQESTSAASGYLVDQFATHSIASFRDLSTSRAAASYEGTYASSSVLNTGTAPIGFYGHAANTVAGFYDDTAPNAFRAAGSRPGGSDFLSEGAADYGFRVLNAKGQAAFASPGFYVGPAGTVNAPGYVAGNSIGAACTGAPSANFRVVGGLVVIC